METRFFVNTIEIHTTTNSSRNHCIPMPGSTKAGETTVDEGVKAEWLKLDYKFIFHTSGYPGEMEGMK